MKKSAGTETPLVTFPIDEMQKLIESFTPDRLASFLDATYLQENKQKSEILKMVDLAKSLKCASVCVNPIAGINILPQALKSSGIKECYVIDFPFGESDIEKKAIEAERIIKKSRSLRGEDKGNIELDMVINIGRFKEDPQYTIHEINAVCDAADNEEVKVIIRSSELTVQELYKICEIFAMSKATFIKSSTGKDTYGALPEHISIMREVIGNNHGIKAAGGISDAMTAMRLFYAGAKDEKLQKPNLFRIGTSSPLNIITSMSWLLEAPEVHLKTSIIPCKICPFFYNRKQEAQLREEAYNRCEECKHNHYLKNKSLWYNK